MRCSGGVKEGGIGAGGDYSHNMRTRASIDDCTAATGPHSRLLSIQQSTHIICNGTTLLKLEQVIIINVIYLL